jgi:quercetin dioxygenase-like cupin family protein
MQTLEEFLDIFLKESPNIGIIPLFNAVRKIEDVYSVVWYRNPPFQVELFIAPGNYTIPEHTHPNVDSYEVYLGGQIRFSHSGNWTSPPESFDTPNEYGTSVRRGTVIRVKPNDIHGGVSGPSGGVFMSVQKWLNGVEPHSVALDYTGAVMGKDHMAKVVDGVPVLKQELTLQDAAHKEVEWRNIN